MYTDWYMKWTDIPVEQRLKGRRAIYNRCAYIWRRYGIRIEPLRLLQRLASMRDHRSTLMAPVLTSLDGSWELETQVWVDRCNLGRKVVDPFKKKMVETHDGYDQTPEGW